MVLQKVNTEDNSQLTNPCFCKMPDGRIGWTNGEKRGETGNDLVDIAYLSGGEECHGLESIKNLKPATYDEVCEFYMQFMNALEYKRQSMEKEAAAVLED